MSNIVVPTPSGQAVAPNELSRDGRTLAYSMGTNLQTGYVYSSILGQSLKVGRPANDQFFRDLGFDLTDDGRMLVWTGSQPCDDYCGGGVWAQLFG